MGHTRGLSVSSSPISVLNTSVRQSYGPWCTATLAHHSHPLERVYPPAPGDGCGRGRERGRGSRAVIAPPPNDALIGWMFCE